MANNAYIKLGNDSIMVGTKLVPAPVQVALDTRPISTISKILRAPAPVAIGTTPQETIITLTFIFEGEGMIQSTLQELIAQFTVFPFVTIRSEKLSRIFYPLDKNILSYYGIGSEYVDAQAIYGSDAVITGFDKVISQFNSQLSKVVSGDYVEDLSGNQKEKVEDLLYRVYTPLYAIKNYTISSMVNQKDTIVLNLTLGVMDQMAISPSGYVTYIPDDNTLFNILFLSVYEQVNVDGAEHPTISKELAQVSNTYKKFVGSIDSLNFKSKTTKEDSPDDSSDNSIYKNTIYPGFVSYDYVFFSPGSGLTPNDINKTLLKEEHVTLAEVGGDSTFVPLTTQFDDTILFYRHKEEADNIDVPSSNAIEYSFDYGGYSYSREINSNTNYENESEDGSLDIIKSISDSDYEIHHLSNSKWELNSYNTFEDYISDKNSRTSSDQSIIYVYDANRIYLYDSTTDSESIIMHDIIDPFEIFRFDHPSVDIRSNNKSKIKNQILSMKSYSDDKLVDSEYRIEDAGYVFESYVSKVYLKCLIYKKLSEDNLGYSISTKAHSNTFYGNLVFDIDVVGSEGKQHTHHVNSSEIMKDLLSEPYINGGAWLSNRNITDTYASLLYAYRAMDFWDIIQDINVFDPGVIYNVLGETITGDINFFDIHSDIRGINLFFNWIPTLNPVLYIYIYDYTVASLGYIRTASNARNDIDTPKEVLVIDNALTKLPDLSDTDNVFYKFIYIVNLLPRLQTDSITSLDDWDVFANRKKYDTAGFIKYDYSRYVKRDDSYSFRSLLKSSGLPSNAVYYYTHNAANNVFKSSNKQISPEINSVPSTNAKYNAYYNNLGRQVAKSIIQLENSVRGISDYLSGFKSKPIYSRGWGITYTQYQTIRPLYYGDQSDYSQINLSTASLMEDKSRLTSWSIFTYLDELSRVDDIESLNISDIYGSKYFSNVNTVIKYKDDSGQEKYQFAVKYRNGVDIFYYIPNTVAIYNIKSITTPHVPDVLYMIDNSRDKSNSQFVHSSDLILSSSGNIVIYLNNKDSKVKSSSFINEIYYDGEYYRVDKFFATKFLKQQISNIYRSFTTNFITGEIGDELNLGKIAQNVESNYVIFPEKSEVFKKYYKSVLESSYDKFNNGTWKVKTVPKTITNTATGEKTKINDPVSYTLVKPYTVFKTYSSGDDVLKLFYRALNLDSTDFEDELVTYYGGAFEISDIYGAQAQLNGAIRYIGLKAISELFGTITGGDATDAPNPTPSHDGYYAMLDTGHIISLMYRERNKEQDPSANLYDPDNVYFQFAAHPRNIMKTIAITAQLFLDSNVRSAIESMAESGGIISDKYSEFLSAGTLNDILVSPETIQRHKFDYLTFETMRDNGITKMVSIGDKSASGLINILLSYTLYNLIALKSILSSRNPSSNSVRVNEYIRTVDGVIEEYLELIEKYITLGLFSSYADLPIMGDGGFIYNINYNGIDYDILECNDLNVATHLFLSDERGRLFADFGSELIDILQTISASFSPRLWMYKKIQINKTNLTSIVGYAVNVENSTVPVHREGRKHPIYQNMGGPTKTVTINIKTSDYGLVEQLLYIGEYANYIDRSYALVKMNRNIAKSFSDDRIKTNVDVNKGGANYTYLLSQKLRTMYANNFPEIFDRVDGTILVKSNVLNSFGIYSMVMDKVTITSDEENSATFDIMLRFVAVDLDATQYQMPIKSNKKEVSYYASNQMIAHGYRLVMNDYITLAEQKVSQDQNITLSSPGKTTIQSLKNSQPDSSSQIGPNMIGRYSFISMHRMTIGSYPFALMVHYLMTEDSASFLYNELFGKTILDAYDTTPASLQEVRSAFTNIPFDYSIMRNKDSLMLILVVLLSMYYCDNSSLMNIFNSLFISTPTYSTDESMGSLVSEYDTLRGELSGLVNVESSFKALVNRLYSLSGKSFEDLGYESYGLAASNITQDIFFPIFHDMVKVLSKQDMDLVNNMILEIILMLYDDTKTSAKVKLKQSGDEYKYTNGIMENIVSLFGTGDLFSTTNYRVYKENNDVVLHLKYIDTELIRFVVSMVHFFRKLGINTLEKAIESISPDENDSATTAVYEGIVHLFTSLGFIAPLNSSANILSLDSEYRIYVINVLTVIFKIYGIFVPIDRLPNTNQTGEGDPNNPAAQALYSYLNTRDPVDFTYIWSAFYGVYFDSDINPTVFRYGDSESNSSDDTYSINIQNHELKLPMVKAHEDTVTNKINRVTDILNGKGESFIGMNMTNTVSNFLKTVTRMFKVSAISPFSVGYYLFNEVIGLYYTRHVLPNIYNPVNVGNDVVRFIAASTFMFLNESTVYLFNRSSLSDLAYNDIPQVSLFDSNFISKFIVGNRVSYGSRAIDYIYMFLPAINTVLRPDFFIFPEYKISTLSKVVQNELIKYGTLSSTIEATQNDESSVSKFDKIKQGEYRALSAMVNYLNAIKNSATTIRSDFHKYVLIRNSSESGSVVSGIMGQVDQRIDTILQTAKQMYEYHKVVRDLQLPLDSAPEYIQNMTDIEIKETFKEVSRNIKYAYETIYTQLDSLFSTTVGLDTRDPQIKAEVEIMKQEISISITSMMGDIENMLQLSKDMDLYYSSAHPTLEKYDVLNYFFDSGSGLIMTNPVSSKFLNAEITKFMAKYHYDNGSDTKRLFPVFKLYFISNAADKVFMFDDIYSYAGVQDIAIERNRKSPVSTARITIIDSYGTLRTVNKMRSSQSRTPMEITPGASEELYSLMLQIGARIQIRLGYSAYLSDRDVVFNGVIYNINEQDNMITIEAQNYGANLLEVLGSRPKIIYQSYSDIFGNADNLDKDPYMSPNLLLSKIKSSYPQAFNGLKYEDYLRAPAAMGEDAYVSSNRLYDAFSIDQGIRAIAKGLFKYYVDDVLKRSIYRTFIGIGNLPDKYDSAFINVDVTRSRSVSSLSLLTRLSYVPAWIYEEGMTVWDMLQSVSRHFSGSVVTVRPFDLIETMVFTHIDSSYQYTYDLVMSESNIKPLVDLFRKGKDGTAEDDYVKTEDTIKSLWYLVHILMQGDYNERRKALILIKAMTSFLKMHMSNATAASSAQLTDILQTYNKFSSNVYKIGTIFDELEMSIISDEDTDELLEDIFPDFQFEFMPSISDEGLNNRKREKLQVMAKFCDGMYEYLRVLEPDRRKLSQYHVKSDDHDIISNAIEVMDAPNTVDLSFLPADGIDVGLMRGAMSLLPVVGDDVANFVEGIGLLSFSNTTQSVKALRQKERHLNYTLPVSHLLDEKYRKTYATFDPNASTLKAVGYDEFMLVARRILSNVLRDYYGGTMLLMGDQSIFPWDKIFVMDTYKDMYGAFGVKSVVHNFSVSTGFTTTVSPDLVVHEYDDIEFGAGTAVMDIIADTIIPSVIIGASLFRITKTIFSKAFAFFGSFRNKSSIKQVAKSSKKSQQYQQFVTDRVNVIDDQISQYTAGYANVDDTLRGLANTNPNAFQELNNLIQARSILQSSSSSWVADLTGRLDELLSGAGAAKNADEIIRQAIGADTVDNVVDSIADNVNIADDIAKQQIRNVVNQQIQSSFIRYLNGDEAAFDNFGDALADRIKNNINADSLDDQTYEALLTFADGDNAKNVISPFEANIKQRLFLDDAQIGAYQYIKQGFAETDMAADMADYISGSADVSIKQIGYDSIFEDIVSQRVKSLASSKKITGKTITDGGYFDKELISQATFERINGTDAKGFIANMSDADFLSYNPKFMSKLYSASQIEDTAKAKKEIANIISDEIGRYTTVVPSMSTEISSLADDIVESGLDLINTGGKGLEAHIANKVKTFVDTGSQTTTEALSKSIITSKTAQKSKNIMFKVIKNQFHDQLFVDNMYRYLDGAISRDQFANNTMSSFKSVLSQVGAIVSSAGIKVAKSKGLTASLAGTSLRLLGWGIRKMYYLAFIWVTRMINKVVQPLTDSLRMGVVNTFGSQSDQYSFFVTGLYKSGEPFIGNLQGLTKVEVMRESPIRARLSDFTDNIKDLVNEIRNLNPANDTFV